MRPLSLMTSTLHEAEDSVRCAYFHSDFDTLSGNTLALILAILPPHFLIQSTWWSLIVMLVRCISVVM